MAVNEKLIHLEADDDILTVRGHLETVSAERAILVVPKGCKALTRPVGLDLLKRQANDLALQIALVTRDSSIRFLARERGFAVFPSVERAQQAEWQELEVTSPLGQEHVLPQLNRRVRRRQGDLLSVTFFLGCVFLLLAAGFLLIAPSAEVTLVPVSEPVEASIEIRASPDAEKIDFAAGTIPARVVETWVEGTDQIPTVSKKDAPDELAKGTVIFTNKTGGTVEVPEGTAVSTSAGTRIRFVTLYDITVPAEGRARAEVEAVDPGPAGNVGAFMINTVEGSLALKVRVINGEPTSGGSVKRVGTVTQADKEKLKASLLKKLHQEAQTGLEGKLEEGEFIPPESIEVVIIDEIYDKFVDEVADTLGLKIRAVAEGMAIDQKDAEALARSALESKAIGNSQLMPESLEIEIGEIKEVEGGDFALTMRARGVAAVNIDDGFVAGLIRGKSVKEAKSILDGLPLQEGPIVKVSPPWLGRLPWLPFRIHIFVGAREV